MSALDDWIDRLRALPAPPDAEALYAHTAAGRLRLANLRRYLELVAGTRTALIGEAPGWRGMTITGVPFLSLRELAARPGPVSGAAAGDGFTPPDPADAAADWEASSRVVQAALADWPAPKPLSWPIYPHHPHAPGDVRTNRTPRPAEIAAGAPLAIELLEILGIDRVIAVGRKAETALAEAGMPAIAVRHPANGGQTLFTAQVRALRPTG